MSDSELIREVLAEMPDATTTDIAAEVDRRYGVTVTAVNVRAVRSRANRGMTGRRPGRAPVRRAGRQTGDSFADDSGSDGYDDSAKVVERKASRPPRAARVRNPVRAPSPPLIAERGFSEDQADDELFALIDSVEAAVRQAVSGKPQAITGSRELISTVADICDDPELRAANRPFTYEINTAVDGSQTLRLAADIPVQVRPVREPRRGKREQREPNCEWCAGSRQPVPGVSLYLVHGGALGKRQRILCRMHAEPEAAAGATVVPYRVYPQLYDGGAVIMPAKTPMQMLRDRVMRSAGGGYRIPVIGNNGHEE